MSSAIVNYRPSFGTAFSGNPYVRAFNAAQRYGPSAVRAAKAAQKVYRKYKSRSRKRSRMDKYPHIGETPSMDNCKNCATVNEDFVQIDTRTLYQKDVTGIPHTVINAIDRRQRNILLFTGFSVSMEAMNRLNTPVYFNIAAVTPKFGGTPLQNGSFFRDNGTERAVDFGGNINSLEYHSNPINNDLYSVLFHDRMMFMGLDSENVAAKYTYQEGRSFGTYKKFIKVNKQIRYPTTGSTGALTPIILVYWCSSYLTRKGAAPVAGHMNVTTKVIAYFRETAYQPRVYTLGN